jgi:hypothetical protein
MILKITRRKGLLKRLALCERCDLCMRQGRKDSERHEQAHSMIDETQREGMKH